MNNMFKKECPSCRQNIFYCCERNLERSIRNNNFCRKCFVKKIPIESYKKAAKTRKLLGHDKKSKESKVKMVETRRRNDPNHLASKKCWETRRKNGTDKRTPEMNIKTWETRQKNGKDKQTKETKAKLRVYAIEQIEKSGPLRCFVGHNEKQLLDEQEKIDNCKIIRQRYINNLGYTVDGYCKETNTVYEVYELWHSSQIEHDLERQNEICKKLNCSFVIIHDKT